MMDAACIVVVKDAEYKSKFKYRTTGELWGVFVRILENIDRVIMTPYCISYISDYNNAGSASVNSVDICNNYGWDTAP